MSSRSDSMYSFSGSSLRASGRGSAAGRKDRRRLFLEGLEDRCLLAFDFLSDYATGIGPADVLLADVNGDGQPDMIVANNGGSAVDVRLGSSDGSFAAAIPAATGSGPHSIATGDFNGDDKIDIVTANTFDLSLLLGNGDGTFQLPQSLSLPGQFPDGYTGVDERPQLPLSVATGDLDADGNLDLIAGADAYFADKWCSWGYYGEYYCNYFNVDNGYANVLMGNGDATFDPAAAHSLGTWRLPIAVATGDVNGDLKEDVITANYYDLSTLLGDGSGAVGAAQHSGSAYGMRSISLGDVDGDGKLDSLTSSGNSLIVQKGNGDGTFTPQAAVDSGIPLGSAVMGDVDGDGNLDLVAVGSFNEYHCTSYGYWGCYDGSWTSTRQASVVIGNGEGGFSLPLVSNLGNGGYSWLGDLDLKDLTGDDLPDLVAIDSVSYSAIVSINDGDWNPPPAIRISDAAIVIEGDTGTVNAEFTVTIVGDHAGVSVDYGTSDYTAEAGSDYTNTSGTLTFAIGESSKTISVPVHGDVDDESDELLFVNLSNAVKGQIADASGVGTIQDDDTDPVLTISDAPTIIEGTGGTLNAVFTVTLEGERKGGVVTVDYSTFDSGAAAGADYTTTVGTLTFEVNDTSKQILVPILDDTTDEYDEQFYVGLSNPVRAQIGSYYGAATIQDNDAAPQITINNVARNEGNNRHNTSFDFTVSLSAVSGKWVSVNFSTADGTATVANGDYFENSGTVYFDPGETTATITVLVRGDKSKEPNETFFVNLSDPSEATISDGQGVGTITNDDGGNGKGKPGSASLALLVDDSLTTNRKRK